MFKDNGNLWEENTWTKYLFGVLSSNFAIRERQRIPCNCWLDIIARWLYIHNLTADLSLSPTSLMGIIMSLRHQTTPLKMRKL